MVAIVNLAKFYSALRGTKVNLTMGNVPEFDFILKYVETRVVDTNDLAYILATTYWETAGTMLPVREAYWVKNAESWRKKNLRYYPYYGRGYVQLTWPSNYKKATDYFRDILGIDVDFVKNPDLVMNPKYSLEILFTGSKEGWFTEKDLDDFIDDIDEDDPEDLREYKLARKVINGTDKALEIGRLALAFEKALKAGGYKRGITIPKEDPLDVDIPREPVRQPQTPEVRPPEKETVISLIVKLIIKLFGG